MSGNDTTQSTEEGRNSATGRRRVARYAVPVAVAGVAAATIGLVPALADSGDPSLPRISAHELVERMAASDTQQLSGSVKVSADLGLPSLEGLGGLGGAGGGSSDGPSGSAADPGSKLVELASGTHTLRVAVDGEHKQKVSILENAAEYSLIRNGDQVWAYDSAANQAFHTTAPERGRGAAPQRLPDGADLPTTPREFADRALEATGPHTSVTVDGTSNVAGRDAYNLVIRPQQAGSTVDSVRIAVDAKTYTPLRFILAPSSGGKAVVDVGYTTVDFSRPAASTFDFTPPKGTKVTEGARHEARQQPPNSRDHTGDGPKNVKIIGKGWTAIAEITGPMGAGLPPGTGPDKGDGPKDAQKFLDSFGDKVTGKFGSGTVFHTRLINALMTDDGKVFVGAVNQQALVDAANNAG